MVLNVRHIYSRDHIKFCFYLFISFVVKELSITFIVGSRYTTVLGPYRIFCSLSRSLEGYLNNNSQRDYDKCTYNYFIYESDSFIS